jgi:hypothetical protein
MSRRPRIPGWLLICLFVLFIVLATTVGPAAAFHLLGWAP